MTTCIDMFHVDCQVEYLHIFLQEECMTPWSWSALEKPRQMNVCHDNDDYTKGLMKFNTFYFSDVRKICASKLEGYYAPPPLHCPYNMLP